MSLQIGNKLGGFHHQAIRRLMGRMPQWNEDIKWMYLPLEEAMSEVVMLEVET